MSLRRLAVIGLALLVATAIARPLKSKTKTHHRNLEQQPANVDMLLYEIAHNADFLHQGVHPNWWMCVQKNLYNEFKIYNRGLTAGKTLKGWLDDQLGLLSYPTSDLPPAKRGKVSFLDFLKVYDYDGDHGTLVHENTVNAETSTPKIPQTPWMPLSAQAALVETDAYRRLYEGLAPEALEQLGVRAKNLIKQYCIPPEEGGVDMHFHRGGENTKVTVLTNKWTPKAATVGSMSVQLSCVLPAHSGYQKFKPFFGPACASTFAQDIAEEKDEGLLANTIYHGEVRNVVVSPTLDTLIEYFHAYFSAPHEHFEFHDAIHATLFSLSAGVQSRLLFSGDKNKEVIGRLAGMYHDVGYVRLLHRPTRESTVRANLLGLNKDSSLTVLKDYGSGHELVSALTLFEALDTCRKSCVKTEFSATEHAQLILDAAHILFGTKLGFKYEHTTALMGLPPTWRDVYLSYYQLSKDPEHDGLGALTLEERTGDLAILCTELGDAVKDLLTQNDKLEHPDAPTCTPQQIKAVDGLGKLCARKRTACEMSGIGGHRSEEFDNIRTVVDKAIAGKFTEYFLPELYNDPTDSKMNFFLDLLEAVYARISIANQVVNGESPSSAMKARYTELMTNLHDQSPGLKPLPTMACLPADD